MFVFHSFMFVFPYFFSVFLKSPSKCNFPCNAVTFPVESFSILVMKQFPMSINVTYVCLFYIYVCLFYMFVCFMFILFMFFIDLCLFHPCLFIYSCLFFIYLRFRISIHLCLFIFQFIHVCFVFFLPPHLVE